MALHRRTYEVPPLWRSPNIIYIFPDIENIQNKKHYYGAILSSFKDGEIDTSQVIYNISTQVKRITPMNSPIRYISTFIIESEEPNYAFFPRSVKLYKHINRENNILNQTELDPNDCGISENSTCFGPFMTTGIAPIRGFVLKKEDLEIRSLSIIHPEPTIIVFLHYDCGGIPNWNNGASCKLYTLKSDHNNLEKNSNIIPIDKIGAIMIISGRYRDI